MPGPPAEPAEAPERPGLALPLAAPRFHVVGAGRGGTSLLAALLDAHPALEVGFERHAPTCLMGEAIAPGGPQPLHRRLSAYLQACRGDAGAAAAEGRIWGNKITTEQVFALETARQQESVPPPDLLDVLFNGYLKDQLIVFVLRDGRSCALSKMRRAGLTLAEACERWQLSVRCWEFLQRRPFPTICLRFEDLLARPQELLTPICAQLGLAFDPAMLAGTGSERLLPEYRRDGFDLSRATDIDLPAEGLALIAGDLQRCGYGDASGATGVPGTSETSGAAIRPESSPATSAAE